MPARKILPPMSLQLRAFLRFPLPKHTKGQRTNYTNPPTPAVGGDGIFAEGFEAFDRFGRQPERALVFLARSV
jgi:hypothetical protein